jgi:hypothetical protein
MLPDLARFQEGPSVFYEMKANLTEDDVTAMSKARISGQVGIESLSSRLLKLMRKGVTTIRILALLKWCCEHRVYVAWNQLCGIPGETVEDYEQQIELMNLIPHFNPPHRINPVVIDRYSPYFENHAEYGWRGLMPINQCRAAHPHLDDDALFEIAYHFKGTDGVSTDAYFEGFNDAVNKWKEHHEQGDGLFWSRYEGMTKVENGVHQRLFVSDTQRRVIEKTHRIAPVSKVISESQCDPAIIDDMSRKGFVYVENGNVVNLVARTSLN